MLSDCLPFRPAALGLGPCRLRLPEYCSRPLKDTGGSYFQCIGHTGSVNQYDYSTQVNGAQGSHAVLRRWCILLSKFGTKALFTIVVPYLLAHLSHTVARRHPRPSLAALIRG